MKFPSREKNQQQQNQNQITTQFIQRNYNYFVWLGQMRSSFWIERIEYSSLRFFSNPYFFFSSLWGFFFSSFCLLSYFSSRFVDCFDLIRFRLHDETTYKTIHSAMLHCFTEFHFPFDSTQTHNVVPTSKMVSLVVSAAVCVCALFAVTARIRLFCFLQCQHIHHTHHFHQTHHALAPFEFIHVSRMAFPAVFFSSLKVKSFLPHFLPSTSEPNSPLGWESFTQVGIQRFPPILPGRNHLLTSMRYPASRLSGVDRSK